MAVTKWILISDADFPDDKIKFKRGEILFGTRKNKNIITLVKAGKNYDVPEMVTPGSFLLREYKPTPPKVVPPNTGLTAKTWGTSTYYGMAAILKNFSGTVYAFDKGMFIQLFKTATKGAVYGIASGKNVLMSNGVTYYLITLKTKYKTFEYAYVSLQDFNFSKARADDEKAAKEGAQALLNNLCKSDQDVYFKIIRQNVLLDMAEKKGINTVAARTKLLQVIDEYKFRQIRLKTNPELQIISLFKLNGVGCNCEKNGVGFLPLLIPIAIGAGIVLVGFTMYYFLRPEFDASKLHSEYLDKNEAELKAKLGPEAYAKLKENVNAEIQTAAKDAYQDGKQETVMSLLKPIGFGLLGFFLLTKLRSGGAKPSKA